MLEVALESEGVEMQRGLKKKEYSVVTRLQVSSDRPAGLLPLFLLHGAESFLRS